MKGLQTHKQIGFQQTSLHSAIEPHAVTFLKKRTSFWIATLSLFTFIIGNMMGQHGWYTFWASVLGEEDTIQIAYEGTVSPFEYVVDYTCWARYGGDWKQHTFRQAPKDCLQKMPAYTSSENRDSVFSMQYMSSYSHTTEGTGTHAGVDIRVPIGTPVQAIMNGRVYSVGDQPRGFGKFVVIEHPNAPNPDDPSGTPITLFSTYAHLSAQYVAEGDIVHKGDAIALSGQSGHVTGPHLHFSIEREGAPYYPYFPSSMADGYTYSVNPLLYVQADYAASAPTLIAQTTQTQRRAAAVDPEDVVAPRRVSEAPEGSVVARPEPTRTPEPQSLTTIIARLQSRREARLRERIALLESAPEVPTPRDAVVASASEVVTVTAGTVDTVQIVHDGSFTGRGWETVLVRLLDSDGNTVTAPRNLDRDIVLRTEFGEAEFRPAALSPLDFFKGEATVHMLPRGRRTVVVKAMPYGVISEPMKYER